MNDEEFVNEWGRLLKADQEKKERLKAENAQMRAFLEELVKRDKRFLIPYHDYADNFLEQVNTWLAEHPAP